MIGCDLWSDDPGFAEQNPSGITGICGSGIIEAVAELRLAGLLDESGLLGSAEATQTPRMRSKIRSTKLRRTLSSRVRPEHAPINGQQSGH